MLKKTFAALTLGAALFAGQAMAADYAIDKSASTPSSTSRSATSATAGCTAPSKDFDGSFSFDAKAPEASKVSVKINTASVDSNHAERDKHLRSDFLNVDKHLTATSSPPRSRAPAKALPTSPAT